MKINDLIEYLDAKHPSVLIEAKEHFKRDYVDVQDFANFFSDHYQTPLNEFQGLNINSRQLNLRYKLIASVLYLHSPLSLSKRTHATRELKKQLRETLLLDVKALSRSIMCAQNLCFYVEFRTEIEEIAESYNNSKK